MGDTLKIRALNPRWLLERAGYSRHPAGRGFVKPDGANRFHAYYSDGVIHLHYDKLTDIGHHSSKHVEMAYEEARILTGMENGTITEQNVNDCQKLPLLRDDIEFVLSRVKRRPRYIPKPLYRKLIYFLIDLK